MKIKWWAVVSLVVTLFIMLSCAPAQRPLAKAPLGYPGYKAISMAGSSVGSKSSTMMMTLAVVLNKYFPEIEWTGRSGATATNAIYVTKDVGIKIAYTNISSFIDAYGFDKIPESRLRSIIAPSAPASYVFLIPADKPWKSITEVPKGLTIVPGSPGTSAPIACEEWLNLCGLSKRDFNWVPMAQGSVPDAWREGKVDLTLQPIAGIAPWLLDMATGPRKFKPLGLTPDEAELAKTRNAFVKIGYSLPKMNNLAQEIPELFSYNVIAPQVEAFIVCRDDFPEDIAYRIVKICDEHHDEIARIYPTMKTGTVQLHLKQARPPFGLHAGAAKYYQEKGYLK